MKVVQTKLENGDIRLDAVATAKEVSAAFASAQQRFANQMNLKPENGQSIEQLAKEKLGIRDLDSIVRDNVVQYLGPFALDKKNIIPAYPPEPQAVSAVVRGKELSFTMVVKEKPRFELTSYEPVHVKVPAKPAPTDEQVAQTIDRIAASYTSYVTDEDNKGPVANNDNLLIAMEAKKEDGTVVAALTAKRRAYMVGQNYMPEGFDESLLGMMVGETKEFSMMVPAYDDDFNEIKEKTNLAVTVLEIQKKKAPEVTDEWVRLYVRPYQSKAELEEDIRKELSSATEEQYQDLIQQAATEELAKRFTGKISDDVYTAMQKSQMQALHQQLAAEGMKYEDYLEKVGGANQLNMMMMMQARETLVVGYSLDALFRHENMVVTEEDILDMCRSLNRENPQQVKKDMQEAGRFFALRESAERKKAVKWLVSHAAVEYVD